MMSELKSSNDEEGLPPILIVSKFTAARGREIQVMKSALSNASGTKLAFQKLPRHMRRRAMSHNVKRLPRRLREIHLNQMKKSGLLSQQKRPRKYRRRPNNLMSDYFRRQKRYKWLNTHLWHAKRFHMIEKWGYKLPFRSCDKTFRACYRATINHCLLQDISYYSCIEIIGAYDTIVDNFKKISNPNMGLSIAAKAYTRGSREGSITMFRMDNKRAIGTVYFNWKPCLFQNNHILWVWIHAAYYSEALDTLICCFDLKVNSMEVDCSNEGRCYTNSKNVELKELNLNRFRLTGPLSNSVLQNCFCPAECDKSIVEWEKHYNANISEQMSCHREYWSNLKNIASTTELPPHMILSLIIGDPRLHLPRKRTKSLPEIGSVHNIYPLPENMAEGPIWNPFIRKTVADIKLSNFSLSELRKNLLVPGTDLEEEPVPIPIMLIQRPGKRNRENIGYGSGWDIIIPSGWAQPIWTSLIMWGARPGGLKETNSVTFEMNGPNILYPDTSAGEQEELSIAEQCKEIYFKLPPNKRTNYNKFKISSPFHWNWRLLLKDWSPKTEPIQDFFVLRDQKQLRVIQDLLSSKLKVTEELKCFDNCLIPVSIRFANKGLCKKFAIICVPLEEDNKKVPTEEKCLDKNEKLRKELRSNHRTLLQKLRRRRIRAKKNGKEIPVNMDMLKNYKSKMKELWLPQSTNMRHSCSREVIGFVRDGDFSFLLGESRAIGYIAMNAVQTLLSLKTKQKVLVRNTNSKQYRLVYLGVQEKNGITLAQKIITIIIFCDIGILELGQDTKLIKWRKSCTI